MAPANRRTALITAAAALAAGVAGFLFFFRPIHDDDVWLHFAVGRWILEHGTIPRVDYFSCTAPGAKYIDHEWLAQVMTEWVRAHAGLTAVRALLAGAAAVGCAVAARTAVRLRAGFRGALTVVLAALWFNWHLARLRPHLFTLACTAILVDRFIVEVSNAPLARLRDALPRPAAAAGLAALMIFWGNVHAAVVIGPALLAVAAAGAWAGGQTPRAMRIAAAAAIAGAAMLVNPYGADVFIYAFETQGLAQLIPEWKSPLVLITDPMEVARMTAGNDFRASVVLLSLLTAAVVPLAIWSVRGARRGGAADPALAAAAVAMLLLAFSANRHDLFLFIPLLFGAHALAAVREAVPGAAAVAKGAGALALLCALMGIARDAALRLPLYAEAMGSIWGDVWPAHEAFEATAFMQRAGLEGACLNRPPWGGYLLYHCFPNVKVAFDGRITTLGADVYLDVKDFIEGRRAHDVMQRYNFDMLMLQPFVLGYGKPPGEPAYVPPDLGGDWVEVYRDPDVNREGAAVIALRRGSPHFEENMQRVRAMKDKAGR